MNTMAEDISPPHWVILDAGHKTGMLNWSKAWEIDDKEKLAAMSNEVCMEIAACKEADMRLLEIVTEAIHMLEMPEDERLEYLWKNKIGKLFWKTKQENEKLKADLSTEKGKTALVSYEATLTNGKPVDIDLTTMSQSGSIDVKYDDGTISIFNDTGNELANCGMFTEQWFNGPVKIELRAKTDSTNIRLYYCYGELILNWESNLDELRIHDVATSQEFGYSGCGGVPVNEFVDIEWLIGRDVMAVKVNGELRHAGTHYPYINKLKEPNNEIGSKVRVTSDFGSTVTVESLRVTELT